MKKAFLTVLLGNTAAAAFAFLLNVFLARTLPLADYGRINLVLAYVAIAYSFFDFGISNSIVIVYNRFGQAIGRDGALALVRRYLTYLTAVALLLAGIAAILHRMHTFTPLEAAAFAAAAWGLLFYRHCNALNQARGDWRSFNLLTAGNNLLRLLLIASLVLAAGGGLLALPRYGWALRGLLVHAGLLLVIAAMANAYRRGRLELAPKGTDPDLGLRGILVPIGLAGCLSVVIMRFGTVIVDRMLGAEQLAIFSAANVFAMVVPLATSSLMNVLIRESARSDEQYPRVGSAQSTHLPARARPRPSVAAVLLSRPLFLFVYGPDYLPAVGIFNVLVPVYLGGMFFTPLESYFFSHRQHVLLRMRSVRLVVVVVGSVLLIPVWKLYARGALDPGRPRADLGLDLPAGAPDRDRIRARRILNYRPRRLAIRRAMRPYFPLPNARPKPPSRAKVSPPADSRNRSFHSRLRCNPCRRVPSPEAGSCRPFPDLQVLEDRLQRGARIGLHFLEHQSQRLDRQQHQRLLPERALQQDRIEATGDQLAVVHPPPSRHAFPRSTDPGLLRDRVGHGLRNQIAPFEEQPPEAVGESIPAVLSDQGPKM